MCDAIPNAQAVEDLAAVFHLLGDPGRLRLLTTPCVCFARTGW